MLLSHILPATYQAQQQKSRAKDQMNFQREMSNTSYQRQMADMRAAGLNPILAAKMGGASTPSGALAGTPNVSQTMASTVQQATQMRMAHAQVATQQQTAKKMSLENEMLKLDLNDMRDKNLSRMGYKHTAFNQGLSMLLNEFIKKGRETNQSLKNDPLTINDITSSIKQLLNPSYEGKMPTTKELKNMGYILRFGPKIKPHYFNKRTGDKIYVEDLK